MRLGISRLAVEVVILVIAVTLALMVLTPVGGFVSSALGRAGLVSPPGFVQAMGGALIREEGGYSYFVVFLRNLGPSTIGDPSGSITDVPSAWTPVVNGQVCAASCPPPYRRWNCSIRQHNPDSALETNAAMEVYEVWEFGFRCPAIPGDRFKVTIYGPSGVKVEYLIERG